MITVMSVPRTGTRFFWYFIVHVLGREAQYVHFCSKCRRVVEEIIEGDDVIVVPVRDDEKTYTSARPQGEALIADSIRVRDEFIERLIARDRVHFIDVEKSDKTPDQIRTLLFDLRERWTPEVTEFVNEWEPVGSQFRDTKRSQMVLRQMLKLRESARRGW